MAREWTDPVITPGVTNIKSQHINELREAIEGLDEVFTNEANGLAPLSDGSATKYLRADGTWQVPPDTDTQYALPVATEEVLGGIKAGGRIDVDAEGGVEVDVADKAPIANPEFTGEVKAPNYVFSAHPFQSIIANADLGVLHNGKKLQFNSSSDITLTIKLQSVTAYPLGFEVVLFKYGAGDVIVGVDSGVTLRSADAADMLVTQYKCATLSKIADNEWLLVGGE